MIDPITFGLLDDPISTPCCGNSISRNVLVQVLQFKPTCPLCKANLNSYDIVSIPKNRALANIIDEYKKDNPNWSNLFVEKNIITETKSKWKATITPLFDNGSVYKTLIGQLEISNSSNINNFKTLLIPVIDVSGSMGGNPTTQAKYSLQRILDMTYSYPNIITNIVTYSDCAKDIAINTGTILNA